jgi:hypothetical protein
MSWLWRLLRVVTGCLALVMVSCGPVDTLLGQPAPTSLPGEALFQDDYSQMTNDWGIWERSTGTVSYAQGGLRILVDSPNVDLWSVAGKSFGDVRVESEVRRMGGAPDNVFGLICRYQDNQNFYMFLVSSDGYYGIARLKDNQYGLIGIDQLQYSSKIQHDAITHQLRGDCIGESLKLYLDGDLLMDARDGDFTTGDVGVLAGAYSTSGVDILFDNFIVTQP